MSFVNNLLQDLKKRNWQESVSTLKTWVFEPTDSVTNVQTGKTRKITMTMYGLIGLLFLLANIVVFVNNKLHANLPSPPVASQTLPVDQFNTQLDVLAPAHPGVELHNEETAMSAGVSTETPVYVMDVKQDLSHTPEPVSPSIAHTWKITPAPLTEEELAAKAHLEHVLGLVPNAMITELLAKIYLKEGKIDEAQALLVKGLEHTPRSLDLAQGLAEILVQKNDRESAIQILEKVQPYAMTTPLIALFLGELYYATGRYSLAVQLYNKYVEYYPEDGRFWTALGLAYEAQGRKDTALSSYLIAQSLSPKTGMGKLLEQKRKSLQGDVSISSEQF